MRKRVGHIEIDTIAAERSKFTAPVVLVHGLWCTSSVWHRFMGYLAHRGWDCHAVNLRGRVSNSPAATTPAHLTDHLDDLNAVLAACDAPPIVIGHDVGGLLALSTSLAPARATVALAPLLPAPWRDSPVPGLTDLRARIALRWHKRLPAPGGRTRRTYFGTTPPQTLVTEAAELAHDLCNPALSFTLGPRAPALVVVGDTDDVTPPQTVIDLAGHLGADVQRVAGGGHALPWEDGWQERADELHRWIIRTLGDSLLAMLDEEESE